ncbi:MAG: hypothetical protein MJZ49_09250, partial [Bacteroidales bacterium]|nr:hypothetical protein [Bacteroidales bacterium]
GMVTEAEISTRIGTARREGRDEANLSAAEALLRDNDPVERVSRVLKLPLEKVQELADKIAAEKARK